MYLPVVDTMIGNLKLRYGKEVFQIAKVVNAVSTCDITHMNNIDALFQQYAALLKIDIDLVQAEMKLFASVARELTPDIVLSQVTQHDYPQYYKLIQLALTLPVGTSTAERSFSTMRRVNNWLRSTMSEDRLSSLALLNIENDLTAQLSPDDIAATYASNDKRRFQLH